jgi:hypothetical protein
MKKIITAALFAGLSLHAATKDKGEWKATMNRLSKALAETVPYLYPDPKLDEKGLTAKVRELHELTKNLDLKTAHGMKIPDDDPALPYIASMFRQEVERAYLSLQEGHAEYGKSVLRSSVSYCITCHTRHDAGSQFPLLAAFAKPLERASWIERLEFQTASRQYDTVLSEVMGQLKSPGRPPGMSALDLERGARMALSLLVRIKKDPDRAALLAAAMGSSPSATLSMKEAAKVWQKDLGDWKSERNRKFESDAEILAEARRLTSANLTDHAEVRFLRATVLMHDLLQRNPSGEKAAEALYLAGRAYNQLGEIGMWSLHEFYYVACIDKAPHTAVAESCYKAYEESMVLGYSGSSGIHIPKAVREHLAALKSKAALSKRDNSPLN